MSDRPVHDDAGPRQATAFSDGSGLAPLEPLDLNRVGSFSDLLAAMKATSFGGRQLGEAADILEQMASDPDTLVVGTFTGAMTAAKQGLVLCDMVDHGLLDAIVCTGALMVHGFVEQAGMVHFKVPAGNLDDRAAYYSGYDRIYDTLELESNLDRVERIVCSVLDEWPASEVACSRLLNEAFGRWLDERGEASAPASASDEAAPVRGILTSAWRRGVPVYVPAFTDSEIGLDFALFNRAREDSGLPPVRFDPFLDLEHYAELVAGAKRLGIFTVGGGVPRNWAQQVAPYLEASARRAGEDAPPQRFRYGVRICPEPEHWGGLSGCGYSEGVSWGKFVPVEEGGRFAEVPADATLVWPLLVAGVLERLGVR